MIIHYIIAAGAFFGIFILFLVLSKTLNNVINQFAKLQYLLQKEYDLKKERIAITKLLKEQKENDQPSGPDFENGTVQEDSPSEKSAPNTVH